MLILSCPLKFPALMCSLVTYKGVSKVFEGQNSTVLERVFYVLPVSENIVWGFLHFSRADVT